VNLRIFLLAVTALVSGLVAAPQASEATTVLRGYKVSKVASGFTKPTALEIAPDGRIFDSEQGGKIRVIKNGKLLEKPFLTLKVNSEGSRGAMGVTFPPDFPATPHVYVHYTPAGSTIENRVSRFTVVGDAATNEVRIFTLGKQDEVGHQGGDLHFGPDEKLYISTGDNDNGSLAPKLDNLFGKILRINADGSIPDDNPFVDATAGPNKAIWAKGLRNPFNFAFQPGTGKMIVNDVGENTWEEINEGSAGADYGWPSTEGTGGTGITGPIFRYGPKSTPGGCAITGGDFYNPTKSPAPFPAKYVGDYFYADFCSGWISALDFATNTPKVFATGAKGPVDLGVSKNGDLYFLTYGSGAKGSGTLGRIRAEAS
jgi:glucose/arabinose dehydrogenase